MRLSFPLSPGQPWGEKGRLWSYGGKDQDLYVGNAAHARQGAVT
jgi:hypothetical protein